MPCSRAVDLAPGDDGDPLPELGGDERRDRMHQPQHRFEHAQQRAPRRALLGLVRRLQLHLGDLEVPVAVLVPDERVDRLRDGVEPVFGEALLDCGFDALQLASDPAVGLREDEVVVERLTRRALGLGVLGEAAVLALAVHQHEAGRVPELVAEVAVALAALGVEVDVAAKAGERAEGEAQRVGAEAGNAVRELGGGVLAHARRCLRPTQAGRALLEQRLEGDAVDQVDRIEHVALRLAHPLALRVAHQAVDVDVAERHLAGEVQGHHDHPGDPEEDDVVAGDEHRRRQEELELLGLLRPAERRERHQRRRIPGVEHVGIAHAARRCSRRPRPWRAPRLRCGRRRSRRRRRTRPGSGGPTRAGARSSSPGCCSSTGCRC